MNTVILALLWTLSSTAASSSWYEHYERGLHNLDQGRGAEALRELQSAVALRSEPELRARTEGPRYVDYTPYLFLAVAAHMTGAVERARDYLARSEEAGLASQTEEGRKVLEAYRVLLKSPGSPPEEAAGEPPGFADYERKPVVLSDEEYREIQERVLSRCGLQPGTEPKGAPWYFHYELGLELAKRQDPQRAVDALVEAVARQPDARRGARMYGMWFIDYLPYFELAREHVKLGNRSCALDALRLSRQQGEVPSGDKRLGEFRALEEELVE